jgi:hypothetical protein
MRSRRIAHRARAPRRRQAAAGGFAVREPRAHSAGGVADGDAGDLRRASPPTSIDIHGAREHNLKNVDVKLKLNQFTVITGVSGSGKSTLAFDILFAEGQRRYLESLNAYARQFVQPASRPDVDAIFGIPPTVAIEQRTSRGGHKSTVATLTEIYHFLRLLYVKLGVQYCPVCEARIEPQSTDAIAARLLKDYRGKSITLLAPLIVARKGLYTALAKWARGKGFSHLRVDGNPLPTVKWPRLDRFIEHNIELPVATLKVSAAQESELRAALDLALEYGRGVVHVESARCRQVPGRCGASPRVFSTKRACPNCGTGFPELDPRLFSFNSKHGWCKSCFGTGLQIENFDAEQSGEESVWRDAGAAGKPARRTATRPMTGGRTSAPIAPGSGSTLSLCTCCSATSQSLHSRICPCGIFPRTCKSSNSSAASAKLRAICSPSLPRAPPFSAMSAWAICN